MKQIFLLFLFATASLRSFSQAKLLARSNYNYNDTTATHFLSDSTKYWYKAANPTFSTQMYEDGYVSQKEDSSHNFGLNGASMTLNARVFMTYNAAYSALVTYDDTVYGGGVPAFSYHMDYYFNGNNYDSILTKQTTYPAATTIISSKQYFHQNAQNLIDTFWSVYFNGAGVYSSSSKQTTVYNANNLTSATYSYTSNDSVNYTPDSRIDYFYGPGNRLDSMVVFVYQAPNWVKAGRREYTYNGSGNKVKMEYKGIDQMTQTYLPVARDEYIRSNGTQLDSLFSQLWSSGNLKYDTTVKRGYVHSNGLLTKMYSFNYDVPTSSWVPNPYGSISNFYYNVVSGIKEALPQSPKLTVYPNPAQHEIRILDLIADAHYTLLSSDGRLVQKGNLDQRQAISTQSLPSGTYILLLDSEQGSYSQLFMKQ